MIDVTLIITAGKPFLRVFRMPDVINIWPTIDLLEVRAQLRAGKTTTDPLISNLHDFMTWDFELNDLVITWSMSGNDTRVLYDLLLPYFKKGSFNIIVSDVGMSDVNALVVPTINVKGVDTTTTALDVL